MVNLVVTTANLVLVKDKVSIEEIITEIISIIKVKIVESIRSIINFHSSSSNHCHNSRNHGESSRNNRHGHSRNRRNNDSTEYYR